MKIYNVLILDDEEQNNKLLCHFLKTYCSNVRVIGTFTDVASAYAEIIRHDQLILFLDIELGSHQNGFELVDLISTRHDQVIIVSAYPDYAIQAFRYQITDFLMKPIRINELVEAINRSVRNLESVESLSPDVQRMGFQLYNKVEFVEIDDILYFKAELTTTEIKMTHGKSLESTWRIGEIEERLNPKLFFRVHKSFIINKRMVRSIMHKGTLSFLEMVDGSLIPIARRKKKATYLELDI